MGSDELSHQSGKRKPSTPLLEDVVRGKCRTSCSRPILRPSVPIQTRLPTSGLDRRAYTSDNCDGLVRASDNEVRQGLPDLREDAPVQWIVNSPMTATSRTIHIDTLHFIFDRIRYVGRDLLDFAWQPHRRWVKQTPCVVVHRERSLRSVADAERKDPHVRELDDDLKLKLRLRARQRGLAPTRMAVSNCTRLFWCLQRDR